MDPRSNRSLGNLLMGALRISGHPALNHVPSESPLGANPKAARNPAIFGQLVNRGVVNSQ
jgi:hypothetical protein